MADAPNFESLQEGDALPDWTRTTDLSHWNRYAAVKVYEKAGGRMGTMLFFVNETRWTNQRGELVRIGNRTTIYY